MGSDAYKGKGVTFYAQVVEGGVRVAAVATHSAYAYTENNTANWYKNTNLEMRSGSRHFYLTSRAVATDEGPLGRAFYTVRNRETNFYTTVAEAFFTADQITVTEEGTARLGFAWKTVGDQCNNGYDLSGNASDWWMVPGHNGDADKQFYVTKDGIFTEAPATEETPDV